MNVNVVNVGRQFEEVTALAKGLLADGFDVEIHGPVSFPEGGIAFTLTARKLASKEPQP